MSKKMTSSFLLVFVLMIAFSSCLTSKKMDKFVAKQYNDELPTPDKKKQSDIVITSAVQSPVAGISATESKTSNLLPLVFYWQVDYKNTCTLNSNIAVTSFSREINGKYAKSLRQKLNGQNIELTIEQVPDQFAFDDKSHMVWLVYAFAWDKFTVQPSAKDMIVSYKTNVNGQVAKTGRIVIKNKESNQGLRYLQSWKSAVSEYISAYNTNITAMTHEFATKLNDEL